MDDERSLTERNETMPTNESPTARMDAAFAAGPGGEQDFSGPPETLPKLTAPARRLAASDLGGLLDRVKAKATEVERLIAKGAGEVEAIDSRWKDQDRRMAQSEIRNRVHNLALGVLADVRTLTSESEAQRPLYTPAVLEAAATFSDDPVQDAARRQSWALRAQAADTPGLQALALLARLEGSAAAGAVVGAELRRRDGIGHGDRKAVYDLLPRPPRPAELATIEAIRERWQDAELAAQEWGRPGSTNLARMQRGFGKAAA